MSAQYEQHLHMSKSSRVYSTHPMYRGLAMTQGRGKDRPWAMMKRNEAADKLQDRVFPIRCFQPANFYGYTATGLLLRRGLTRRETHCVHTGKSRFSHGNTTQHCSHQWEEYAKLISTSPRITCEFSPTAESRLPPPDTLTQVHSHVTEPQLSTLQCLTCGRECMVHTD